MDKRKIHVLGILMMIMATVSESSVMFRRRAPSSSGDGELLYKDKVGSSPEIWEPADFSEPEDNDIANDIFTGKPGAEPTRYPSDLGLGEEPDDGDEEDVNGIHGNNDGSSGADEPLDGEEDFGGDGHPELPFFEDGHEFPGGEEGEEPDEGVYDQMDNVPVYGYYEDLGLLGKETEMFGAGSILDVPILDLRKVRQYFHQLERTLEQMFKMTLDEARLLNGTYANTTEEEVDIDGKKFIVQKSLIKGGNNDSSIYIETLSSKQKEDGGEDTNGMEVSKNETHN